MAAQKLNDSTDKNNETLFWALSGPNFVTLIVLWPSTGQM